MSDEYTLDQLEADLYKLVLKLYDMAALEQAIELYIPGQAVMNPLASFGVIYEAIRKGMGAVISSGDYQFSTDSQTRAGTSSGYRSTFAMLRRSSAQSPPTWSGSTVHQGTC